MNRKINEQEQTEGNSQDTIWLNAIVIAFGIIMVIVLGVYKLWKYIYDVIGIPGTVVLILILTYILIRQMNKKSEQTKLEIQKNERFYYDNLNLEKDIRRADPNFTESIFLTWSKEVFIQLQQAWTKRDWNKIRPFESDEIFNQHKTQIEDYIRNKQINVREKISIPRCRIKHYCPKSTYEILKVDMLVVMRDYVVDEETKKVIEGKRNKNKRYRYELSFIRTKGVKTKKVLSTKIATNCPNCGAPSNISSLGECKYCDTIITTGKYDWVLANIMHI